MKQTLLSPDTVRVFCAGELNPAVGAGAAAYAPYPGTSMALHVDDLSSVTSHKADLVAIWLAARLAKHLKGLHTTNIYPFSHSQPAITSLLRPSHPSPGQHLRRALWDYRQGFNSPSEYPVQV